VTFTGVHSNNTAAWRWVEQGGEGAEENRSTPAEGYGSVPLLLNVIRSFYENSHQFVRNPLAGFDLPLVLAM